MASQEFDIGEVVIFVPDFRGDASLNKYAGEVEVLEYDDWMEMYRVSAPDGWWFFAHHCVLRKRPQPPDWKQLAKPTDLPLEVEHV